MVDFNKVRIGEIGSVITGRTPKTSITDNYGNDIMFLGPSDLHKHFIITNSEKMITDKGLASIKSATIDGLSICTGCIGWDMGNVALVKSRCATNQQINSITNIKNDYNPYYIYYWLKGKKDFLFQQASVTRTPILNKTDFSSIEISVPSKNNQDKVANFLTVLDKKIELNNKINAELEAMAKLIYDYWFVQFDFPNANGKPYKSSGGKMVYNEDLKREIPEGWVMNSLSDWIESDKTGDWGKETEQGNYTLQVDCVRGADINGLNGMGKVKTPNRFILQKNKYKLLRPFDLVVEISGGSPVQSTGRIAYFITETFKRFNYPLICSNFCKAISLVNNNYFYNFIYQWKAIYDNGILFGWEGKTSGIKNLLFDSFVNKHNVCLPPENIAKEFFSLVETLEKKK